jgi:hypothetical protein
MKKYWPYLKAGVIGAAIILIPGLMFLSFVVLVYNKFVKKY